MTKEKTQKKEFIEAISVLQWVLSFLFLGVACLILMVYLMFTSLWPLASLYFVWLVLDWYTPEKVSAKGHHLLDNELKLRGKITAEQNVLPADPINLLKFLTEGGRRTAFVRKWKVWEHFRDYFPIKLVKTAELSPKKNYIFGIHPHGIMSAGGFACFSTESCGFAEAFPGVKSTLAILAGLFKLPLFREYLMSAGLCPVSRASLVHLLSKNRKGNAVVIVVGGAAESLASSPGVNTLVMKQRKGFVRIALEFGADLVPVYSFGENELFQQVVFSEESLGRRLQDLFKKIMGFAPCLFVGERFALLPYRTPVTTVVGSPISVPKCVAPTEEEVDRYHCLYMEALTKLFHEHKVSCGLSENHKLRII